MPRAPQGACCGGPIAISIYIMGKSTSVGGGRTKRQLRNFLLDRRFQLKYASYLVAIAVGISVLLGAVLFRTSAQVVAQSESSVRRGEQIVALGHEVLAESKKVSAVVRMNIVSDPIYQDDPELLETFNADVRAQDKRLAEQKKQLQQQQNRLAQDARTLKSFYRSLIWTLVGLLAILVVGIGLAGIWVTHKVAGPIFKMKRHLREVAAGSLEVPRGLRRGDELVDFFEALREMIESLRERRQHEVDMLNRCLASLDSKVEESELAPLRDLRDELVVALKPATE